MNILGHYSRFKTDLLFRIQTLVWLRQNFEFFISSIIFWMDKLLNQSLPEWSWVFISQLTNFSIPKAWFTTWIFIHNLIRMKGTLKMISIVGIRTHDLLASFVFTTIFLLFNSQPIEFFNLIDWKFVYKDKCNWIELTLLALMR